MERFSHKLFLKTEGFPFCIENMFHIHGLLHSTDQCAKEVDKLASPEESQTTGTSWLSHCFSTNESSLKYRSENSFILKKSLKQLQYCL